MKIILAILLSVTLVGCGTLGGAVSGGGDDLKKVGNWIKPSK